MSKPAVEGLADYWLGLYMDQIIETTKENKMTECLHEGTMGILDLYRETVTCEECGYTEDADPYDIEEQHRILAELDKEN